MVAEIEKLKEQIATLGGEDRVQLARFLLESMDERQFEETLGNVLELDPEFLAELERREKDYLSGESVAAPAKEVFARLREKYS